MFKTPRFVYLVAGIILCGCSFAQVTPWLRIITLLSGKAGFSPTLVEMHLVSQWCMGIACLFVAIFFKYLLGICRYLIDRLYGASNRSFYIALFLISFGLTFGIQSILFDNIPHVADATCHVFQAKVFSEGKMYASAPTCFEAFQQPHMVVTADGKWFSKYTPIHALSLALAMKLGAWLLFLPMCTAGSSVLLTWLAARFCDVRMGRWLGISFAISPLALLLGGSFMSHTVAFALLLAGMVLCILSVHYFPRVFLRSLFACCAGCLVGLACVARIHETLVVGFLVLLSLSFFEKSIRVKILKNIPLYVLGSLPPLVIFIFWNWTVYGAWWNTGYSLQGDNILNHVYMDRYGLSEQFPLWKALQNTGWTLRNFHTALLGWPIAFPWILFALWPAKTKKMDIFCFIACCTVFLFYFFHPYYGHEFEARYYYLALPFTLWLLLRGTQNVYQWCVQTHFDFGREMLCGAIIALFLHSILFYWPVYIWPKYSENYEGSGIQLHRVVEDTIQQPALILVQAERAEDYSSGFVYNDPFLQGKIVYARYMPTQLECLQANYPGRVIMRAIQTEDPQLPWQLFALPGLNPSFP